MEGRRIMTSPIGKLELLANTMGLYRVRLTPTIYGNDHRLDVGQREASRIEDILELAEREIDEYFCGTRTRFSVPVAPEGTPLQISVWKELQRIRYGERQTYGSIARKVGVPKAARAVGTAIGRNPLPIIIPCHRVVPANGGVGGYAWGPQIKEKLLRMERVGSEPRKLISPRVLI
jgi:methylated-DNA-[protein]-cysteine S-methyltransferase